ncbi:TetR/AcrR family transcriptional regulator [Nocardioides limicola]|uniref:TetR/AcrR family transcriptional regulator n=1 Tax=Nocardioides limicola TaxID=2803368 RepID=UPI00193C287C|nr:TetR family transcriptional regulator [Nocardioides sp. DJM-14]
MAAEQGSRFSGRMQELRREAILDAAWRRAAEVDWSEVRVADLAEEVGVARQTIYNEFGAKPQLAAALMAREMQHVSRGLVACTAEAADLPGAVRDSLRWLLEQARANPVVSRSLAAARRGSDETLLPLLTVHSTEILASVRRVLVQEYLNRWPELDPARLEAVSEIVIRWTLSQLLSPSDLDEDPLIDQVAAGAVLVVQG